MKQNCWDVKGCGRQLGGENVKDLGVCPAAVEMRLDGVNDGRNAGRACWAVAGTLCGGRVQGTFAQKFGNCEQCEVFTMVAREQFPQVESTISILKRLERVA
jgi:hypothetical protein